MNRTSHININTFKTLLFHADTHFAKMIGIVTPYSRDNRLLIFCKSYSSTYTKLSLSMAIAYSISKFSKKHIWSCCFAYYMTKDNICYVFPRSKHEKWSWEIVPKIILH